jgi:hypothetical protein
MVSRFEFYSTHPHSSSLPRKTASTAIVTLLILTMLISTGALSSCSSREGWAVVLWPPEESALGYCAVVPVHFKSNITRTYAVGVPGSSAKEELDLWRIEPYASKAKAKTAALAYGDLAPVLGLATRDGLLLRTKPANTADQVFRLKLGQPVKLLRKEAGAAVETGGERLAGDWYLALADDGTQGYVFSNQLLLWNTLTEPKPELAARKAGTSASVAALFDTVWRPDYFNSMLASGLMDLGMYQPRFGIFADPLRKVIRVERPDFSKVYRYESIEDGDGAGGSFELVPTGASFRFTDSGSLSFTPPESDIPPEVLARLREEQGDEAIMSYQFSHHENDVQAIVAAEERKRLSRLSDFVDNGERFESEQFGVFIVTRSARFTWAAYGALSPDPIPEGAGETGLISMDLFLSPELAVIWNGAFTLRFDEGRRPAVSFAYRFEGNNLVLAYVPPETIQAAVISTTGELAVSATLNRYR